MVLELRIACKCHRRSSEQILLYEISQALIAA